MWLVTFNYRDENVLLGLYDTEEEANARWDYLVDNEEYDGDYLAVIFVAKGDNSYFIG